MIMLPLLGMVMFENFENAAIYVWKRMSEHMKTNKVPTSKFIEFLMRQTGLSYDRVKKKLRNISIDAEGCDVAELLKMMERNKKIVFWKYGSTRDSTVRLARTEFMTDGMTCEDYGDIDREALSAALDESPTIYHKDGFWDLPDGRRLFSTEEEYTLPNKILMPDGEVFDYNPENLKLTKMLL